MSLKDSSLGHDRCIEIISERGIQFCLFFTILSFLVLSPMSSSHIDLPYFQFYLIPLTHACLGSASVLWAEITDGEL